MMKAYTDGACRLSNPGLCSCAWVLYGLPGGEVSQGMYLGPELHTNNYAEYMGIVLLLEFLYLNKHTGVTIHSDSELVVNQVNQSWQINDESLRKMATKAYGLLSNGRHTLVHIKGHAGHKGNERADEICNAVLDANMEEYERTVSSKA